MGHLTVRALRDWRESAGLTQEQAGARVGVSRWAWHKWESGQHLPSREQMIQIFILTEGEVRPDHFYQLPVLPRKMSAAA